MRRHASTLITEECHAGLSLLQFLVKRFTYLGKEEWRKQIAGARVLLNDKPAPAEAGLQLGDAVAFICHDLPEPPVALSYQVIHEDRDLLVVNKPAPLPCHPRGRYFRHTLWALLKEERNGQYFSFVNRIDRETSGIVLIAKNKKAARDCQRQFISQQVDKQYLAVVIGLFPPQIDCRGYLIDDRGSSIRHKVLFTPISAEAGLEDDGKRVHTEFRLLRTVDRFSLIAARPHSGRRHQIRATLAALNFPLLGDKLYAADEGLFLRFTEGRLEEADKNYLAMNRQALHASRLSFRHPNGGKKLSFHAPLPSDMEIFWANHGEGRKNFAAPEASCPL